MSKTEKKLTQKEQLEQDVKKFDQQIESLRNQLMQLIGAKTYAQAMLKQIEEGSSAVCKKGKNDLQEGRRTEKEGDSEK